MYYDELGNIIEKFRDLRISNDLKEIDKRQNIIERLSEIETYFKNIEAIKEIKARLADHNYKYANRNQIIKILNYLDSLKPENFL